MSQRLTAAEFQAMHGSGTVVRKAVKGELGTRLPKLRHPNNIEAEWMKICREDSPLHVLYEPFTLNLPDGTKYTPDVVVIAFAQEGIGIRVSCCEVKGTYEHNDRWKLKFKAARAAFPWLQFIIAKKQADGQWTTSE